MPKLKSLNLVFMVAVLSFLAVVCHGFPKKVLTLERAFPLNETVELHELRARDRLRHARMLQRVFDGVVNFPLDGTSDPYYVGLYFTKVRLGTPPREFNVQIDTGSDILWVNCNSCDGCPRSSGLGINLNFFDVGSSSSASLVSCSDARCLSMAQTVGAGCSQSNQCTYTFQYGDGSGTSGYYVADLLNFDAILPDSTASNSSAPVVFGCSMYQSGDLTKADKAIDGIFGFGQQPLSVISQLYSQGITPRVFSHCLKGEGSGGGKLVLGEIQEPGIVYTPIVQSQPHYNLVLQSIAVNGALLSIDPAVFAASGSSKQGTIIDSGTTLTYLVADAYDPFVRAISAIASKTVTPFVSNGHQCYLISSNITEIFPEVSLNFAGGASMFLKPQEYLMPMGFADGAALWCMGFQRMQGMTILGDLVLKDKIVVYDLPHQRIGWTNYDCSMSVHVSLTSSKDEFLTAGSHSTSSSSNRTVFDLLLTSIVAMLIRTLSLTWL